MSFPMSGLSRLSGVKRTINEYEIWLKGAMNMWDEWYVYEYNDGSASKVHIRGPFSEKDYFKLLLKGRI